MFLIQTSLGIRKVILNNKLKNESTLTYSGGISGGEPALPYAYSGLQVIFATSPTWYDQEMSYNTCIKITKNLKNLY
jgi:hypothetical protein